MTLRQEALLFKIIEHYIAYAEPISSHFISEEGFHDLSSASIRSEMNQLEHLGYLEHVHTSSGRVPTDKGYRYLLDSLLNQSSPDIDSALKRSIKSSLQNLRVRPTDTNRILARLISDLTDNLVITIASDRSGMYQTGLKAFFDHPELRAPDVTLLIAGFLDKFESIFHRMLHACGKNMDDIDVFIGTENPIQYIPNITTIVMKCPVSADSNMYMTIVGPRRMDYIKTINIVRYLYRNLKLSVQNYEY